MTENRPEMYGDNDINDLACVLRLARLARPPRDVVPRTISPDDAPPLPLGPVTVQHTEVLCDTETGVPVCVDQFETTGWMAAPVTAHTIRNNKEEK